MDAEGGGMNAFEAALVVYGISSVLVGMLASQAPYEEVDPPHTWESAADRDQTTITTRETA